MGSRVSGIAGIPGHEAHSHSPSPQRPPPIGSRGEKTSINDSQRKLHDFHKSTAMQTGRLGKGLKYCGLKNSSPEHQFSSKLAVDEDDPFVSSHQSPAAIQQWRLQLRSTSHDMSMPDYTSSKTDRSIYNTEMSGVSVPRADFVKQVNDANPEEIVQALSPSRRDELLKVLSASNSPATGTGTRPPMNTPQMSTDSVANQDQLDKSPTIKLWHEPQSRPRTSSGSSLKSTLEPKPHGVEQYNSPRLLREMSLPIDGMHLRTNGPRSLSLNVGRQRSASNGSKRKRRSSLSSNGHG